jgi:hypothetical protein
MSARSIGLSIVLAGLLAGCGGMFGNPVGPETDTDAIKRAEDPYHTDPKYIDPRNYDPKTQEGVQNPGLVSLFFSKFGGNNNSSGAPGGAPGVGVNSYLWRASLDTVSFMPLASADPFGGVIITDWYSPAETPDERFKVNVFILDRQLRADGLRAAVFKQKRQPDGRWIDAPTDAATQSELENAILARARQLRISTAQR